MRRPVVSRPWLVGALLLGTLAFPPSAHANSIIDITLHGTGAFDQSFFSSSGVHFTEGTGVGFIQGDEALVFEGNRIAGLFAPAAVTSMSVRLAPAFQGTAVYRLAALDVLDNVIDSHSVLVTQDTGDPEHSGFGYFEIELTGLPGAVGFLVDNTFVRSSYGGTNTGGGMSVLEFTKVPEPGSLCLVSIGGVLLLLAPGYRAVRRRLNCRGSTR